jgi:signal transduction histidine kinase
MVISDGGQGFSPEAIRGRKGLGLVSMKERVELVGGTLRLESRPGNGVRKQIDIPLEGERGA